MAGSHCRTIRDHFATIPSPNGCAWIGLVAQSVAFVELSNQFNGTAPTASVVLYKSSSASVRSSQHTSPSMIQIPPLAISNSVWAFAAFLFLSYGLHWRRKRSQLPLPPGPKKLPLVGNLFDIPAERQWETYLEWSKQFSGSLFDEYLPPR
jgi:hypothetical protein